MILLLIDKITKSRNHDDDDDRTINDTGYEYNNNNGDNIHKYNNYYVNSSFTPRYKNRVYCLINVYNKHRR